jgi:phosphoglycerate dehydrogenase-like enzyme
MRLSVHILHPPRDKAALSQLRAELHADIRLSVGPELATPAGCDILIAGRPQREQIMASPGLQALIIPWAGIPEPTRELMLQFPHIAVHNLHHNALPVAEHVMALLLAAAKFIVPMDRSLRAHDWRARYQPSPSILLAGKTALILGSGSIGQRVMRLCSALDMQVVAIRRHAAKGQTINGMSVASFQELHRLLPQAHILIICLPHTPETTGLIGAQELALLPPQAILVNIGRGPIVDEGALYEALRGGTLYAAALDVWYDYPGEEATRSHTPPSAYPFHELDNVVMSPHRAGGSTETERLRMTYLAKSLNAAARGEPLPNRVDLQAGY